MNNDVLIEIENYIKNNELENALELILSNEDEYANNADFWNLKGVLCFNAGETETGIGCFSRAIALDSNHESALENLNYVKSQYLDNTIEDTTVLMDEEFITSKVDILDNAILKIELSIETLNEGDLSVCMDILKEIQNYMKLCKSDIERLKKLVDSRFMPNLFDNILLCIEECVEDYNENFGINLELLIEFTIYPLLKELREEIYFFGLIYPHSDKMDKYYKEEFALANANHYAKKSLETGEYKYPVSILVPAYNKIEYTKQCVESILKYTKGIDYELILVNDGSSDGTREYFESVPYANKKIISFYKNTGAALAYIIGVRVAQGRILASVSNDVIVTKDWLKNLLLCLESDSNIGIVVPTTNSISNNQAISIQYDTIEEMQKFAREYNKSDCSKWLERERICPFVHVIPMNIYGRGICYDRIFQYSEFSDDDISLQLRLNGYKIILAKDTFCHHFGSVSLGESQRKNNSLEISRRIYEHKNKVDPWDDIENENSKLLRNIKYKSSKVVNVLCIDPGFGMVPYGIRNIYKENGNSNVNLYNFSTDKRFLNISSKIFNHFVSAETTLELLELFNDKTFEYIIFCRPLEEYENGEMILKGIKKLLSHEGEFRFLMKNPYSAHNIIKLISINDIFNHKMTKKFVSQVAIEEVLLDAGYKDVDKVGIELGNNKTAVDIVKKMASIINIQTNNIQDSLYRTDLLIFTVKA